MSQENEQCPQCSSPLEGECCPQCGWEQEPWERDQDEASRAGDRDMDRLDGR